MKYVLNKAFNAWKLYADGDAALTIRRRQGEWVTYGEDESELFRIIVKNDQALIKSEDSAEMIWLLADQAKLALVPARIVSASYHTKTGAWMIRRNKGALFTVSAADQDLILDLSLRGEMVFACAEKLDDVRIFVTVVLMMFHSTDVEIA